MYYLCMRTLIEYINEALNGILKDGGTLLERMKEKYPVGYGSMITSADKFLDMNRINDDYNQNKSIYKKIKFTSINHEASEDIKKFVCLLFNGVEYIPSDLNAMAKIIEEFVHQDAINPISKVNINEPQNNWDDYKGSLNINICITPRREIWIHYYPSEFELKSFRTYKDERGRIMIDRTKHKDGTDA